MEVSMRRHDKEIKDPELISRVIRGCQVCRLGLALDGAPYIVPVSFGYDGDAIYFHTAKKGKKIDYITANNSVCFEFEHGVQVVPDERDPCDWSFSFQSVIGYGRIQELVTTGAKVEGLNRIMEQYSGREWAFGEKALDSVRVWKIAIDAVSGKQSKDKAAP
jgi:nitroimidazol reductase NimA-like FMN-containing flavoprotein (pyridoxamine 5'-phosphate oxidase superfamily)